MVTTNEAAFRFIPSSMREGCVMFGRRSFRRRIAPSHADDGRRAPTTTAGVSLGVSLTLVHWMHSMHKPDVAAPRTLLFSCIQRAEYVPVRGFTGFDSPRLHGKTLRVFWGFLSF